MTNPIAKATEIAQDFKRLTMEWVTDKDEHERLLAQESKFKNIWKSPDVAIAALELADMAECSDYEWSNNEGRWLQCGVEITCAVCQKKAELVKLLEGKT